MSRRRYSTELLIDRVRRLSPSHAPWRWNLHQRTSQLSYIYVGILSGARVGNPRARHQGGQTNRVNVLSAARFAHISLEMMLQYQLSRLSLRLED